MPEYRIEKHPILPIPEREKITFTWQGQELTACQGETIASRYSNPALAHLLGYSSPDSLPRLGAQLFADSFDHAVWRARARY